MNTATRIDTDARTRPASPLDAVHLSEHDRRQAERDMHSAERMVDFIFAAVTGLQTFARRLRGLRVAH